jgi:sugar O-acyltransferase (sialic acid O-acetyltransferase NeuD family)
MAPLEQLCVGLRPHPDKPLLLIAASGLAREVLAVVRAHGFYNVVGILDDAAALANATIDTIPVLGSIEAVRAYPEAQLLVCAGRGVVRERIVTRLDSLGVTPERYATLVHPTVEIPAGCRVGAGSIILVGVALTTAVTIGNHVVIMPNAVLTHDCALDDYATLCAGTVLGGNVVVQRGAYLGMNSAVRERITVGAGATLGMGAALLLDLPAGETWIGVPARPLLQQHKTQVQKAVEGL